MLVLTRKTGQKLIIDNDIVVTVLETRGDSVKIGIAAPKHIQIYREEIFQEITEANKEATSTSSTDALDAAAKLVNKSKPGQ